MDAGNDSLLRAAGSGDVVAVDQLLALGYSPDGEVWGRGWSPLSIAAYRGHIGIVQTLLQARADPNQTDGRGLLALDYAAGARHKLIVHVRQNTCLGCRFPWKHTSAHTSGSCTSWVRRY